MSNRKRRFSLVEDIDLGTTPKTPRRALRGCAPTSLRVEQSPAKSIASSLFKPLALPIKALGKQAQSMFSNWSRSKARKENSQRQQANRAALTTGNASTVPMVEVASRGGTLLPYTRHETQHVSSDLVQNGDAGPSTRSRMRSKSPIPPAAETEASGEAFSSQLSGSYVTAPLIATSSTARVNTEEEDRSSTQDYEEGTLDQPIELGDTDDDEDPTPSTSQVSSSQSDSSPRPTAPLLPNAPPKRPQPSRPSLSGNGVSREYQWFPQGVPGSPSRDPLTARARQRHIQRQHPPFTPRNSAQHMRHPMSRLAKENGYLDSVLKQFKARTDSASGRSIEQDARVVKAVDRVGRSIGERKWKSRVRILGRDSEKRFKRHSASAKTDLESKSLYGHFLQSVKTAEDVTKSAPTKPFSPHKPLRTAKQAQSEAALQRVSSVDDIVSKFKAQILEEEEKITKRLRPSAPTKMSTEREQTVAAHYADPAFKVELNNIEVKASSLSRLKVTWLDDEIINFYGAMIQTRADQALKTANGDVTESLRPINLHFFNSFFYERLSTMGYEKANLKRWTKKFDLFAKDLVIFPINISNAHWTAAAINFHEKRIEYYDSMSDCVGAGASVFRTMFKYLDQEHRQKKGAPFDRSDWVESFNVDAPQQNNSNDCGVFASQTLEALARGKDLAGREGWDFDEKNMKYFRKLMVLEIAQRKLEPRWPTEK